MNKEINENNNKKINKLINYWHQIVFWQIKQWLFNFNIFFSYTVVKLKFNAMFVKT